MIHSMNLQAVWLERKETIGFVFICAAASKSDIDFIIIHESVLNFSSVTV